MEDESLRTVNPMPLQVGSPLSSGTSSLGRRICRICQSETGDMVNPCNCQGTMGNIHENCLAEWVRISNHNSCEICNESYVKKAVFKPLKEWNKPKFGGKELMRFLSIIGLSGSLLYLYWLAFERKMYRRLAELDLAIGSDDTLRILLVALFTSLLFLTLGTACSDSCGYIRKQKAVRFRNKPTT